MAEITITATPYGPKAADDYESSYLHRCAEILHQAYGYDCTIHFGGSPSMQVRQLQINIPDENITGGIRPVQVIAPQVVVDINGTVEVFPGAAAAIVKYPSLQTELEA